MNTYPGSSMRVAELERIIRYGMPGWKLCIAPASDNESRKTLVDYPKGSDLEKLQAKFLGTRLRADPSKTSAPEAKSFAVKVEPLAGGPSKVILIDDGKIAAMQG